MWKRFTFEDIRIIAHYLGTLTSLFSVALLIPLITAFVFGEWEPATRYFLAAGISLTIGSLLRMSKIDPGRLTRQQAMALTGFVWMVLAFIASIPLAMSGHYANYLDALFDGVSGLTTTGACLVMDLDHLSYADNMWRFVMHFLGGMGLIVIALSLGLLSSSTSGLYSSEGRSEHVVPNVITTTRLISQISLTVIGIATILLMIFCLIAGMEPVRAFLHGLWISISGFMTAGFTPTSQSIMYYHSYFLELACMILMILGMVNFGLFVAVWRGKTNLFFKDMEIRTAVIWLVFMGIVFMATLSSTQLFSDLLTMLRRGVFMMVSAASTTGFQVITTNQLITVLSSGAILILAILMAVGGSSGSTAGGMKLMRIGLTAKSIVSSIKEAISPDTARVSVVYHHIGKQVLNNDVARAAMTVSTLFVVTYVIGALAGIAHGYDATAAIAESVAMASNGGLSFGITTQGMPKTLETIYIIEMWAGRLEFITLIALIVKIVVSILPVRKAGRDQ